MSAVRAAAGASAPCPLCRGAARPRCAARDRNRQVSETVFHYLRCASCGAVFLADPPADLERYYPADYYTLPDSARSLAAAAAPERYKIEIVRRYVRSGRLIEVGPGRGNFCFLAREAGFAVTAIERSRACREFLERALGVETIRAEDEHAALERSAGADVIAMWHVLEHLSDPWRFLDLAARKLNPGGVLVAATPNPGCLQFALFGARWAHLDAPRHLVLIPPHALAGRLESRGLRTELLTTTDPGSLGWNRFGWMFSLANLFPGGAARRAARLAGRCAALAAYAFERAEGRGAAYTGVFRRAAA